MSTVGELFILLGLKIDDAGWSKGLKTIGVLRAAAQGLAQVGSQIAGMVEHSAELGTHLLAFSQSMGMAVGQTQEWGYVAQQSGSNLKELSVGISMFERNLRTFAEGRGGKALRSTMSQFGISIADAKAALASPDGLQHVLEKTADKLKSLKGTAQGGALGQGAFGARAGRAMVADLEQGSEGIRKLQAHFRELGGELSEKQVTDLKTLNNALNDTKLSFGGLINQIVAGLAPALVQFLTLMREWIAQHHDAIVSVFTGAVTLLTTGLRILATVFGPVLTAFAWMADHGTFVISVLAGIATTIFIALLPALSALGGALALIAIETVVALWPWILLAAAIAAAIYLIIKLWDWLGKWKYALLILLGPFGLVIGAILLLIKYASQIGAWFRNVFSNIGDDLRAFADFVTGIPGAIVDAFVGIGHKIKEAFGDVWDWIKGKAKSALGFLVDVGVGGGSGLSGMSATGNAFDQIKNSGLLAPKPVANGPAKSSAGGGAGGGVMQNVTNHNTVAINAGNADAAGVKRLFDDDQNQRNLRHAAAATGAG